MDLKTFESLPNRDEDITTAKPKTIAIQAAEKLFEYRYLIAASLFENQNFLYWLERQNKLLQKQTKNFSAQFQQQLSGEQQEKYLKILRKEEYLAAIKGDKKRFPEPDYNHNQLVQASLQDLKIFMSKHTELAQWLVDNMDNMLAGVNNEFNQSYHKDPINTNSSTWSNVSHDLNQQKITKTTDQPASPKPGKTTNIRNVESKKIPLKRTQSGGFIIKIFPSPLQSKKQKTDEPNIHDKQTESFREEIDTVFTTLNQVELRNKLNMPSSLTEYLDNEFPTDDLDNSNNFARLKEIAIEFKEKLADTLTSVKNENIELINLLNEKIKDLEKILFTKEEIKYPEPS